MFFRKPVHPGPNREIVGVLRAAMKHDNQRALTARFAAWDINFIVSRTSLAGEGSREISRPIRHRHRRRFTKFRKRRQVWIEARKIRLTQQLQNFSQRPFHAGGGKSFSCGLPHACACHSGVLAGQFEHFRSAGAVGLRLTRS